MAMPNVKYVDTSQMELLDNRVCLRYRNCFVTFVSTIAQGCFTKQYRSHLNWGPCKGPLPGEALRRVTWAPDP
eukprot:gene13780-21336_t